MLHRMPRKRSVQRAVCKNGPEEVKAMLIGNGDFVRPVLNPCIKEKCVAYKDGKCLKYNNEVERKDERTNI